MNIYIVNDLINSCHKNDCLILALCNNKTNSKYIHFYLDKIKPIRDEAYYKTSINMFQNYEILHIKKRLPILTMLDQNHFHYDGFYGACSGGHIDLVDWIYSLASPALGLGLKGAKYHNQNHVIDYLERKIEEQRVRDRNDEPERQLVKSMLGLYV